MRAYQLVPGATGVLLTDKMIFVISHDDEVDPLAVSVCVHVGGGGGGGCTVGWGNSGGSIFVFLYSSSL